MAFHFKKKESPTRAVRRLSRERIGKALDYLRQCDRLEAIHSVRKEIKKVRATLGLVRGKMGENTYRKRVKTLRAAAKRLQDPRDARVRPQALERLVEHFKNRLPARPFAGIKKVLKPKLSRGSPRVQEGQIRGGGWPSVAENKPAGRRFESQGGRLDRHSIGIAGKLQPRTEGVRNGA